LRKTEKNEIAVFSLDVWLFFSTLSIEVNLDPEHSHFLRMEMIMEDKMNLSDYLKKALIFPKMEMQDRTEIYSFLISEMHKVYPELDVAACLQGLEAREQLGSMVYPNGVAIPHTRIEQFPHLAIAIATFAKPVFFGKEAVKMVVMIITSSEQSALYLKAVAGFAKIASRFEHVYAEMIKSHKAEEIIQQVNMAEVELESQLLARDIMGPASLISRTATVKDATDMMKKNHVGFLAVVDDNMRYIGEINNLDILKLSIPEYVMMMEDLSFLLNFEPFKEFLRQEKSMLITNIIKCHKVVSPNTSMVEVVFLMLKNNMNHIAVADKEGKVVGVITTKDIVEKILRL
jgi:mannitol/fructose-specific phosphotransferase system IIA component (Ntr-type)/CBS domain-containing protein